VDEVGIKQLPKRLNPQLKRWKQLPNSVLKKLPNSFPTHFDEMQKGILGWMMKQSFLSSLFQGQTLLMITWIPVTLLVSSPDSYRVYSLRKSALNPNAKVGEQVVIMFVIFVDMFII